MELLEQCRIWHENDEHQKIIDALEAIPEGERTRSRTWSWPGPATTRGTPARRRAGRCFSGPSS